ncbi:hypothetical protein [Aeromonas sp. HMWF014]|uniref:hypothetical protein n=1 Tax=Aeromonas sp. HMWF014 TaxID=2056850 RepID=UPI0015E80F8E|nr:hypothetical protein [Aeromonas sp. HMWF014]
MQVSELNGFLRQRKVSVPIWRGVVAGRMAPAGGSQPDSSGGKAGGRDAGWP